MFGKKRKELEEQEDIFISMTIALKEQLEAKERECARQAAEIEELKRARVILANDDVLQEMRRLLLDVANSLRSGGDLPRSD